MRWIVLLIACAAILASPRWGCAAGAVMRDGKSYLGKVEFKAENQVAITPASGDRVTVPLSDVARLSMSDAPDPASPATTSAPASTLPSPWRNGDVGDVKSAGDATEASGAFALHGAGWGIWGASDSFHFAYQPLVGDCDLIARLAELPTADVPFQAGLTIRQGLEAGCSEASVMIHPGGKPHLNSRPLHGAGKTAEAAARTPNPWVRLIRAGDTCAAWYSADGHDWRPLGTANVKFNGTVYAGLACATMGNQGLALATFDHVSLHAEPMGPSRGLGLVDGSLLAAQVRGFDAKTVRYADAAGAEHTIATDSVASIFNRPLPPDLREGILQGHTGISLASGDSVEADVKSCVGGRVGIESVVFGQQNIELAQVVTIILRPMVVQGDSSLYTSDGSVYRCKGMTAGDGIIAAQTRLLGTINVNAGDLLGMFATHSATPSSAISPAR